MSDAPVQEQDFHSGECGPTFCVGHEAVSEQLSLTLASANDLVAQFNEVANSLVEFGRQILASLASAVEQINCKRGRHDVYEFRLFATGGGYAQCGRNHCPTAGAYLWDTRPSDARTSPLGSPGVMSPSLATARPPDRPSAEEGPLCPGHPPPDAPTPRVAR